MFGLPLLQGRLYRLTLADLALRQDRLCPESDRVAGILGLLADLFNQDPLRNHLPTRMWHEDFVKVASLF